MNTSSRPGLAQVRLTSDIITFTIQNDTLMVLLIKRGGDPFSGSWALPGGFLWENETSEESARRVLEDKGGVSGVFMEQLYTFDGLRRDPRGRVVSVVYYALVPPERLVIQEGPSTEAPTLHPALMPPKLAFDHGEILEYAVKRLQAKLNYTNAAYSLLPERFTLSQLQRLYEIVHDTTFDKRNFRKKFLSLGLITATDEWLTGGRHRPAQLYRFISTDPTELTEPAF